MTMSLEIEEAYGVEKAGPTKKNPTPDTDDEGYGTLQCIKMI